MSSIGTIAVLLLLLQNDHRSADLTALGDRMFREARFEDAAADYSEAITIDPRNAQGKLGMGKISSLHSEKERAAAYYSAAYRLAPRNPDAILAFAGVVENSESRQILLRNFLAYSRDARVEDVRARLQIAERMGTRPLAVVNHPSEAYRIPLTAGRTGGASLLARINGGRDLKLILDTGATGIVLNASAGAETDLEFLANAALCGFGSAAPTGARIALATWFETGGLRIANLPVHVSERNLMREADGVIGADVFENFLIHVDPPAGVLELTPFSNEDTAALRAYRLGNLLLVNGTINGRANGYFVLDSGSQVSMISRKLLSQDGHSGTMEGTQGLQQVALPSGPVNIRLGDEHYMDFDYATFDAGEISSRNGTEIAGAIGYSVLRNLKMTIDYRAGLVKLEKPARR